MYMMKAWFQRGTRTENRHHTSWRNTGNDKQRDRATQHDPPCCPWARCACLRYKASTLSKCAASPSPPSSSLLQWHCSAPPPLPTYLSTDLSVDLAMAVTTATTRHLVENGVIAMLVTKTKTTKTKTTTMTTTTMMTMMMMMMMMIIACEALLRRIGPSSYLPPLHANRQSHLPVHPKNLFQPLSPP